MSSYVSTVSISDQEWNEIQRKISDTNAYIIRKSEEANRIRSEIARREQEIKTIREQAERTTNDSIGILREGVEFAVSRMNKDMHKAMDIQITGLDTDIENLNQNLIDIAKETNVAAAHVSSISQKYTEVVGALIGQEKDSEVAANIYIQNMSIIYGQLQNLNPDVYEPGAYSEVMRIMEDTALNIKEGRFQAALATSQFGILKASSLLTKLIVTNDIVKQEMDEALQLANVLKGEFDKFDSEVDGGIEFTIDDEVYEYDYDIDHWSDGRFSKLRREFDGIYHIIMGAKDRPIPLQQITDTKKKLKTLEKSLKQCDEAARKEMSGSIRAQETAARVCDSLMDLWKLDEHGFAEGDNRNPYTMIYHNPGGSISIAVSPGMDADTPNVFIEAFAEDEVHADIIKQDALSSLSSEGLCVTDTRKSNDCSDNKDEQAFLKNTIKKAAILNEQRKKKNFDEARK